VPGKSRQHKSEKRRKELTRQSRQKEKREKRGEKGESGGGPPIDWSEALPGTPLAGDPVPEAPPAPSEDRAES
jgi:hypothetical protein